MRRPTLPQSPVRTNLTGLPICTRAYRDVRGLIAGLGIGTRRGARAVTMPRMHPAGNSPLSDVTAFYRPEAHSWRSGLRRTRPEQAAHRKPTEDTTPMRLIRLRRVQTEHTIHCAQPRRGIPEIPPARDPFHPSTPTLRMLRSVRRHSPRSRSIPGHRRSVRSRSQPSSLPHWPGRRETPLGIPSPRGRRSRHIPVRERAVRYDRLRATGPSCRALARFPERELRRTHRTTNLPRAS